MAEDLVRIRYRYDSVEQYQNADQSLRDIITADTGMEAWIETRSLPPMGYPPPLHAESVQKLKELDGVLVEELKDD